MRKMRKAAIMAEQKSNEPLSFTNDYVFRRIFGEKNIEALADFLSAVLGIPESELGELVVDDPNLHRERAGGKASELDVRVHTKSGEIINVEIQVNPDQAFGERIVYYNDRLFTGQHRKGEDYRKLNRTISVVIANFILFCENGDWLNRFRWYNIDNRTLLTDKQEIDVLELPKLPEKDNGTRLWRWLRLLLSRKEEEMEELAGDNKAMQNVIVTYREMSADEAERRLAEAREKELLDRRSTYLSGIEVGEARGEAHAKHEHAARMKADGVDIALIEKYTGLSAEEIRKIGNK